MAEYIERDVVKKVFEDFGKSLVMAPGFAARQIGAIPAADVAPVVHGRWIPSAGSWLKCSHCNEEEYFDLRVANYCPNCGVRMDGE